MIDNKYGEPTPEPQLDNTPSQRPIFIVGAGRSGTTLLQYMLRSHPEICAPPGESHFIVPLQRSESKYGKLGDSKSVSLILQRMREISPEFTDEDLQGLEFDIDALAPTLAESGDGTMAGLIRALFDLNAKGEGKRRWADKTPYYVLHIPLILEMFPDAQFVHIIRDGRDCALSMLGRKHELRIYNLYHAAQIWAEYVDAGQASRERLSADQYHELRYEDLLDTPEDTLHQLCEFLNVPFDMEMVNFRRSTDTGKRTPLLSKGLDAGNREKWRTVFNQRQLRIFESEATDTLARNGYPVVTRGNRLPLPARAAYRGHIQAMDWISRRWINPPRNVAG